MDLRNVIFAIALSFAVLFGWSVIFETPQIEKQKELEQVQTKNEDSSTPSVNLVDTKNSVISREEAVKTSARVIFENENVKGSISLKGALIDDITFNEKDELNETSVFKKPKNKHFADCIRNLVYNGLIKY